MSLASAPKLPDFLHTRPFNFEHAKAGAPVCTRDGRKVKIYTFDSGDHTYPIHCQFAGYGLGENCVAARTVEGHVLKNNFREAPADLCMAPICYLEGKPVFVGDVVCFSRDSSIGYKVKPDDTALRLAGAVWPITEEPKKESADKPTFRKTFIGTPEQLLPQLFPTGALLALGSAMNQFKDTGNNTQYRYTITITPE